VSDETPAATSARLITAAAELFAERGFRGTSIRDIAERAGVNVAAGHYHYGSKEALYLQVLRDQFGQVGAIFRERGVAQPTAAALRRMTTAEVEALLEARIAVVLEFLLGPPPSLHGALMMRELSDPTDALPIVVAEFIQPQVDEMGALVRRLAPHIGGADGVRRAVMSIFGQLLFYRFNQPAVLLLMGRSAYPPGFPRRIARHLAAFSLGGLARVAHPPRRRRRAS
jgi:AcrR family transcriptional regulator